MMIGSLLSYVGWFFFAAWSLVVGAVNVVVFGKELLPSKVGVEPPQHPHGPDAGPQAESSAS
ncbi:MAG TPA: hypothetical protein VE377_16270 [Candidatus Dormibacteraeota bacterium]|nr:hypothetical protein [Candidatus Dormibacteraeota bacterium]